MLGLGLFHFAFDDRRILYIKFQDQFIRILKNHRGKAGSCNDHVLEAASPGTAACMSASV
jgi:hypothetical protein